MRVAGLAFAWFFSLALTSVIAADQTVTVEAANKPGEAWKTYPTRFLSTTGENVLRPDAGLDNYGGLSSVKLPATGFFYPTNYGGRWWLVDPAGGLFIHKGVVSVAPLRSAAARRVFEEKFGTTQRWAQATSDLLWDHGFNGVGAWSQTEPLRSAKHPLVYTRVWNFMSSYGKKRGGTYQQPGHTGYPNDCIFVFDAEFETFCAEHARQLAATSKDPWLLGHFSDNELPLSRELLKKYLELPPVDEGRKAAQSWLASRHGPAASAKDITAQDQSDFLAFVVSRYFQVVAKAIKANDPNHLFLGSRFHGASLRFPEVFKAAGPYVDVLSVNYYRTWTPDLERMRMWERESGRPFLITEWYAKGMDSGLANTTGAGWLVKTQRDRGLFYQNFVLALMESKVCVGWHWFKYIDNDPTDTAADPSNQDSNKGILSNRYAPYAPLLGAMKDLNTRAYTIIEQGDSGRNK